MCAGRDIELEKCHNLKSNELCSVNKNGNVELLKKTKLQIKMGLQTRTLNKQKVEGEAANLLVDSMLSELEALYVYKFININFQELVKQK